MQRDFNSSLSELRANPSPAPSLPTSQDGPAKALLSDYIAIARSAAAVQTPQTSGAERWASSAKTHDPHPRPANATAFFLRASFDGCITHHGTLSLWEKRESMGDWARHSPLLLGRSGDGGPQLFKKWSSLTSLTLLEGWGGAEKGFFFLKCLSDDCISDQWALKRHEISSHDFKSSSGLRRTKTKQRQKANNSLSASKKQIGLQLEIHKQ